MTFDVSAELDRLCTFMRSALSDTLHRRGFVVAMSGGIDSSVCAAIAARAVGGRRVLGLFLPERESDPQSHALAADLANRLGIDHATVDITATLDAAGCYTQRDEAITRAVPQYGAGWRCKLALPDASASSGLLNIFSLVVERPDGAQSRVRLGPVEYRQIVAATNFKQRVRAMMAYHHADRLHYAVVGTPNRLEFDQGFFVKGGDGLADIKPIAHLFKSQVYALGARLGLPDDILNRPPTTDTFPLPQSQEEFYFTLPLTLAESLLRGFDEGRSAIEVAEELTMPVAEVQSVWSDFEQKRSTTLYLHVHGLLVEPVLRPTDRQQPGMR